MRTMPDKKDIIIFVSLCLVALGLGYWYGMPDKDSRQRAEVSPPPAPTVVTNVVTNVLKEVVTNNVTATPQTNNSPPVGKTLAWTAGVNTKSIDAIYRNKTQALVQGTFGKPDKTQGSWLGYTGMNITNAKGEKYGTVWFGFANGVVHEVRFDK